MVLLMVTDDGTVYLCLVHCLINVQLVRSSILCNVVSVCYKICNDITGSLVHVLVWFDIVRSGGRIYEKYL